MGGATAIPTVVGVEDTAVLAIASESPRLILLDAEQVTATWYNVIIWVWRRAFSCDGVARGLAAASIALESPPEGFGMIHVFPERGFFPENELDRAMLVSLAETDQEIHGIAAVIPGEVDDVQRLEHTFTAHSRLRVFSTVFDASRWLCPVLRAAGSVPLTPADLADSVSMFVPRT